MAICKSSSTAQNSYHLAAQSATSAMSETCWTPNTDIYLTEGRLVIKVELAGMRRDDLELSFCDDNRLTISGHRQDSCRAVNAKCKFMKMEINYGAFQSVIPIPSGFDLSKAQAAYQNGFLRIDVPEMQRNDRQLTVPIRSED
jgi:HSP20 family protein